MNSLLLLSEPTNDFIQGVGLASGWRRGNTLADTKFHKPSRGRYLYITSSGVARNLIWGVYVLTSHCNFKTCVYVPHVNKTVTDFGGIYTDIPPVATPLITRLEKDRI